MKRILPCSVVLAALLSPAQADQTIPVSVSLSVGATKRLEVISAHHSDCSTSDARSIEVVAPPALGQLSQQEGVPAVVKRSISGTCFGAHLVGVGVDYRATRPGTDRFEFDAIFQNGRARYVVTTRNR